MRLTACRGAIVGAGLLLVVASPALADTASDLASCKTADEIRFDADVKAACDRYIESGEGSAADRADAFFGRARANAANDDLDAAIVDLGRAIEIRPTGDEYIYRGGYRDMNDDYDGMLADFDTAVRDFPSSASYLARGQDRYVNAEYEKALSDLDAALKFSPADVDALRLRAKSLAELGRRDEAIAAAGALLEADPRSADAYRLRPVLYLEKGEPARAVEDYTAAIALFPGAEFHSGRANAYMALEQPDKAVEDLKVVLADAESTSGYTRLGNAYAAAGDAANANASFEKALKLISADLTANAYPFNFSQRARVYLALKRYDYALSDYNSAIVVSEAPGDYYAERAKVYEAMGNADKAAADRATAKQLNEAPGAAGTGLNGTLPKY